MSAIRNQQSEIVSEQGFRSETDDDLSNPLLIQIRPFNGKGLPMRYTIFHRDIRKLSLIICLLGLVTLFLVVETLILANNYRQSMIKDVLDQFSTQQINVARQTATGIEKFLVDILRDLELLAQYPQVQKGQTSETERILKQFYEKNDQDVVHFYRLDKDGVMTNIYPPSSAKDKSFAYRNYFQETKNTLKPHVSRFLRTHEHYWTLVLTCPILINQDHSKKPQFGGVIAATVSVQQIRKHFIKPIAIAQTGYGWLMDSEGTVIIHPTYPELEGRNVQVVLGQKGEDRMKDLFSRMEMGETNISQYTYNDITKYAAFSPFRLGNQLCSVAVCAPVDEVKQFMQSTFGRERILLAFVIMAMIGAGVTVMLLVRRIYTMRMEERSRNRLIEIFSSMDDGFCILSPDFRIETANLTVARRIGIDEKDAIGHQCYRVFMGRDSRCNDCPVEETLNRGRPAYAQKQLTPSYGKPFSAGVFTIPLTRSKEDRPYIFCYLKDLTTETSLRHKLTQSKKLATVGEMAAGIAHEMRNPLISIRSAIEMLLESPNHNEEEKTLAHIIHKEASQLERVIREFLVYSQPPRLEPARVQLNDLIQEILQEAMKRDDFVPRLRIESHLAPDLPEAYLDRRQIGQVLWNLLQNARDAIPEQGTITISTRWEAAGGPHRRKRLFMIVEDTGQGFDETLTEEIFKPFFSTKADGVGMGLALVQQIVESHEGNIQIESIMGKGSQFTIRLPVIS